MSTTSEQAVTYVPADAGETLWVLGAFVTFKTRGERDKLSFFEVTCPPGAGPPRWNPAYRSARQTKCSLFPSGSRT